MNAFKALTITVFLILVLTGCYNSKQAKKKGASSGDRPFAGLGAVATKKAESPAKMEAAKSLLKLYKSASHYYTAPRVAAGTGMKIDCQFPQNQDWTPAGSPCEGEGKRFGVDTMLWNSETWSAMNFQMNDGHFAAYKVESSGTITNATITLRARFDTDCDGEWEEMSITAKGDATASHAECSMAPNARGLSEIEALLWEPPPKPTKRQARTAKTGATAEVVDQLDKMYKSAAHYYTSPRVSRTGMKLPCQFPASQDWSPSGSPCDGEGHQFEVDTMLWVADTWSALNFQMNDRHYGAYKVESTGTLAGAKAKLMARTDTNCDGKWEVTTRMIEGDPNATSAECSVKANAQLMEGEGPSLSNTPVAPRQDPFAVKTAPTGAPAAKATKGSAWLVTKMTDLADRACACKDITCFKALGSEGQGLQKELAEAMADASTDEQMALMNVMKRIGQCANRLTEKGAP